MALGGGLQDLSSLFVDQDFRNAFRTDARHVGWQKINDHSQTCCTALATESHHKVGVSARFLPLRIRLDTVLP